MSSLDEFYVGYHSHAPPRTAWITILTLQGIFIFCALLGFSFLAGQSPFAVSAFEFGRTRVFQGTIQLKPYPHLLVRRPGLAGQAAKLSSYLLVSPFKFGAGKSLKDSWLDGQNVTLKGSLIYRQNYVMIELVPNSIEILSGKNFPKAILRKQRLGKVTLEGEVVGSKCYLGVMNPAVRKIHRSCAVRCISGGVPPLFAVTNEKKQERYFLLLSKSGRAVNQEVLPFVAKAVRITGSVEKRGSFLILKANPKKDYQILP